MTFSLRRKHPTTARARRWLTRTAISLLTSGLGLCAAPASAQGPPPPSPIWERPLAPPMPSYPPALPAQPPAPAEHDYPAGLFEHAPAARPVSAVPTDTQVSPQPNAQPNAQPRERGMPKTGYESLQARYLQQIPGPEVLMRLESEGAWKERVTQETRNTGERAIFPDEQPLAKTAFVDRSWPMMTKLVEPAFVCHNRLLFEQKNFERGVWNLGIMQPLIETGTFFFDVAALPYNLGTRPFQQYDTSAGKNLPGDPVPYYLYPPELSLTGLIAEGAAVTGILFMFP